MGKIASNKTMIVIFKSQQIQKSIRVHVILDRKIKCKTKLVKVLLFSSHCFKQANIEVFFSSYSCINVLCKLPLNVKNNFNSTAFDN